jgi:hypothetical protein
VRFSIELPGAPGEGPSILAMADGLSFRQVGVVIRLVSVFVLALSIALCLSTCSRLVSTEPATHVLSICRPVCKLM